MQPGRGPAQAGKKLVIRRNASQADRSPLPSKLRCLKAVEDYNHRIKVQKEARLKRQKVTDPMNAPAVVGHLS